MSEGFGPRFNVYARTGFLTILSMLAGTSPPGGLFLAGAVTVPQTELTVVSNRTKDLVITITSADGRLKGGENSFCALFQKRGTQESLEVRNVSVDFVLLVGRIQEKPIRVELTQDQIGRYCGQVNLGKQYYSPASYYAIVFYTDTARNKKKTRLFLIVK
jgi:hypothetical protein